MHKKSEKFSISTTISIHVFAEDYKYLLSTLHNVLSFCCSLLYCHEKRASIVMNKANSLSSPSLATINSQRSLDAKAATYFNNSFDKLGRSTASSDYSSCERRDYDVNDDDDVTTCSLDSIAAIRNRKDAARLKYQLICSNMISSPSLLTRRKVITKEREKESKMQSDADIDFSDQKSITHKSVEINQSKEIFCTVSNEKSDEGLMMGSFEQINTDEAEDDEFNVIVF